MVLTSPGSTSMEGRSSGGWSLGGVDKCRPRGLVCGTQGLSKYAGICIGSRQLPRLKCLQISVPESGGDGRE